MTSETLSIYHTRTGIVAFEIKRNESLGRVTYSYQGKHGAGSGHDLGTLKRFISVDLQSHKGIRLVSGVDILTYQETK